MPINDLFKPKWKHSDPAVREIAVATLDKDDALFEILERDPEPRVRAAALAAVVKANKPHGHVEAAVSRVMEPKAVFPLLLPRLSENEIGRFARACGKELDASGLAGLVSSVRKAGDAARARDLAIGYIRDKPGLEVARAAACFPKGERPAFLAAVLGALVDDDANSSSDTDLARQAAALAAFKDRAAELARGLDPDAFVALVESLKNRVGSFGTRFVAETLDDRELKILYLETLRFFPTDDFKLLDALGDADTLRRVASDAACDDVRRAASWRLERLEENARAKDYAAMGEADAAAAFPKAKNVAEAELLLGRIKDAAALRRLFETCGSKAIARLLAERIGGQPAFYAAVAADPARSEAARETAVGKVADAATLADLCLIFIRSGSLSLYDKAIGSIRNDDALSACYRALREAGREHTGSGELTARRLALCPFCGKKLARGEREDVESETIPGDALAEIRGWTEYTYRTYRSVSCSCGFSREWLESTRTEDDR